MITELSIIPQPYKIKIFNESFKLTRFVRIKCHSSDLQLALLLKNDILKLTGFDLRIIESQDSNIKHENAIILISVDINQSPTSERYTLEVKEKSIKLHSLSHNGLFYAIQTLKQILRSLHRNKEDLLNIPCLEIEDIPRFSWRGFMLDEARHFFGKSLVKELLDKLASLKFNKFHWHLTDDQGWRIEIKKYPKLIEIGSKRRGTYISKRNFDDTPVFGYYSQEDIREIVDYADDRYIDIIPEFDVPGHTKAAIAAYPELSCLGRDLEVSTRFGIFKDVFCIGNKKTFEFTKDVLREIIDMFPSKLIHIGGDEVPRKRWKACEKCQTFVKSKGLTSEDELQQYFTNEISKFLSDFGVKAIGWNEIIHDNLSKNTIIQYWNDKFDLVIKEIKRNRKIIMSDMAALYLNFPETAIPLKKTYDYDPIPEELKSRYHGNILGLEACLWTEYVISPSNVWKKLIPRIFAVSEIAWSLKENRNFSNFESRISKYIT